MNIAIRGLPTSVTDWQVTKELAKVIHSDEFHQTHDTERPEKQLLINFLVKVNINERLSDSRNDGTGLLTVPTLDIGKKFLGWVQDKPIYMLGDERKRQKLRFRSNGRCRDDIAMTLQRKPFTDPDVEIERSQILQKLDHRLRVDTVQFGLFYHSRYVTQGPIPSREFSVEWEKDYVANGQSAWLHFEHDQKLIRLRVSSIPIRATADSHLIFVPRLVTKRATASVLRSTSHSPA